MAYEKQNFTEGQVLTAAALNQIEDAIVETEEKVNTLMEDSGGVEVFDCTELSTSYGNNSATQIVDAYNAGKKLIRRRRIVDSSSGAITEEVYDVLSIVVNYYGNGSVSRVKIFYINSNGSISNITYEN